MNIYIAIIGTFLAVCEIIRVVQNHINLRRQRIVFERECGQLSDITEQDLQTQREAYRLIVEHFTPHECSWPDIAKGGNADA
jgi:hypothetical protein